MPGMTRNALLAGGLVRLAFLPVSAQEPAPPPAALSGNLPPDFYIKAACEKPNRPSLAKPSYEDRDGVATYNEAVRHYNARSKAFDSCINAYVDKAPNDIDWITFMANMAVAKANGTAPPSPPAAPGNMPAGFYPPPNCILPDKQLGATPNRRDVKAMDSYDTKVRTFNVLATGFNGCVKDYVGRARVDIEQVEQAQRKAALQASKQ